MARPTKLTAELADRICQSLRAGVPPAFAAEANGIDRTTYWQWLELGGKANACETEGCADLHHGPANSELSYVEFVDMVMVAKADAVRLAIGYIAKAMANDPVNARWWLERTYPEAFKLRSEIEAKTVDRGAPPVVIRLVASDRPEEEMRRLASPRTNGHRQIGQSSPGSNSEGEHT